MTDFLNGLGLPAKYAIVFAVGIPLVRFVSNLLGLGSGADLTDYALSAFFGALGGAVVGSIRKRMGKSS